MPGLVANTLCPCVQSCETRGTAIAVQMIVRAHAKAVLPTDPIQSAIIAGLRYVTGTGSGIARRPRI